MNLELIINSAINPIVSKLPISLKIFNGDVIDNAGNATASYTTFTGMVAQVQLENNQKIQHMYYFNENTIYTRFYIQSTSLTGLNRNLSTGGDLIILQSLTYKIVEVNENFQVGWVRVIACQTVDGITG